MRHQVFGTAALLVGLAACGAPDFTPEPQTYRVIETQPEEIRRRAKDAGLHPHASALWLGDDRIMVPPPQSYGDRAWCRAVAHEREHIARGHFHGPHRRPGRSYRISIQGAR